MYVTVSRSLKLRLIAAVSGFSTRIAIIFFTALLIAAPLLRAQQAGSVYGEVRDPLGALVVGASVDLLRDGSVVASTKTNQAGVYRFEIPGPGRFGVRANAPSFKETASPIEIGRAHV